jgi:hypothetical protein
VRVWNRGLTGAAHCERSPERINRRNGYRDRLWETRAGRVELRILKLKKGAHEWYPRECCANLDCAPVERAEPLPDGSMRVTSKVGTTVVPVSFPRRQSQDTQMHICMARFSHLDNMRPVCLFVPMDAM